MRRFILVSLVCGAFAGLTACGGSATPAAEGTAVQQQNRNPNVVTAEDLRMSAAGDLYSAIQRLRPAFFQTRGAASFGNGAGTEELQVYVDGVHRGGLSSLREITAADALEVRRLSAAEATQRFGTGHTQGAILVSLKR